LRLQPIQATQGSVKEEIGPHDTRFAYFVEEVILFGSYLRREERVTDIDLGISFAAGFYFLFSRLLPARIQQRPVQLAVSFLGVDELPKVRIGTEPATEDPFRNFKDRGSGLGLFKRTVVFRRNSVIHATRLIE
jgi:predicted nucleotidyltransferase